MGCSKHYTDVTGGMFQRRQRLSELERTNLLPAEQQKRSVRHGRNWPASARNGDETEFGIPKYRRDSAMRKAVRMDALSIQTAEDTLLIVDDEPLMTELFEKFMTKR